MLSKHLANSSGAYPKKAGLAGRSSRVVITNEAKILRELRLQSGLSMRKAGELLGCSDSYISHIENGRSDVPTGARLDKFLSVYGSIKQKSFYERVRRYKEQDDPRQKIIDMIHKIPLEKLSLIMDLITTLK